MPRRVYAVIIGLILWVHTVAVFPQATPSVEFFSPQGTVKNVRQVKVRFSAPMVSYGDPRVESPFMIDCLISGNSRWADDRNWVHDFSTDLPAGIECRFLLKSGLSSLDGRALGGPREFAFSTGGPAVLRSLPQDGASVIDEEQIFILGLDSSARVESISDHAWCQVEGIAEQIGVRVLVDEERRQVLDQRADFLAQYYAFLTKYGEAPLAGFAMLTPLNGTDREKFLQLKDAPDSPIVVLQCQRRFPPDVDVSLIWDAGIAAATGVVTTGTQTLAYHVREEFRAAFSCNRVNRDAGCIPVLPMSLNFTAPILRADADKIVLQPATGDPIRPQLPGDAETESFNWLNFKGPFPPETEYTVQLPEGLLDDAGRPLVNQASFPLQVRTDAAPPLVKFPAEFGLIEWNDEAALPVTVRNLESFVPLPELQEADAEPDATIQDPREPSWYRTWYESVRDYYFAQPSAAIAGRTLRIEDTQEALKWLRRVRRSSESEGHYDNDKDKYVIDRKAGEKSLFTTDDDVDTFQIEKLGDITAFEVIGIPFEDPGFYVVEIASPRLGAVLYGKAAPYHAQTAVLVTNLSAHFKRGRESSLVWVTALDTGRPVAGAEVEIQDCGGTTFAEGETDESGIFAFTETLPANSDLPECLRWERALVVTVRDGDDMSFTLSSWDEGISRWRFGLPSAEWTAPFLIRTVFDRTLLRAGETVSMKHFARRHTGEGLDLMTEPGPGAEATIQHIGTDQSYTLPLTWDEKGIAESVWTIPADARQGEYQVRIAVPGADRDITTGAFRVEAFRIPTMQAVVQPAMLDAVRAESAEFDIQVNYLSGGGAGRMPVKLRGLVEPKSVSFADYPDFTFGNGTVAEGRQTREPYRLGENGYIWQGPNDDAAPQNITLETRELTLDPSGGARAALTSLPIADTPRDLTAELEYRDANGETLISAAHVVLWPARLVAGLKPDSWAISKDNLKFQALAVDHQGKPAAGAPIRVDLLQRRTYSHRKRLVGGFYAYEHSSEVTRVGEICAGTSDALGLLTCAAPAPAEGNLILRAQVTDADGNPSFAHREVWVAGSGAWWFEVGNEDRMDVLPERKRYEPGETATFQVRMPFRQATALVTVEREGVLDSFVTELSGDAPVVRVPIQGNHSPNIFVSVLAVRGRVADQQPTALVDLGKPAYKLGIAEIQVGRKAHELDVRISADKPVYQVRDTARVDIEVRRADGEELPAGSEVALAAVDAGLLELKPNDSWRLLDAMLERRGIEVETSTAQMQVIGKRHYGKKAVAQGGGGGHVSARELFDTLLLWQGRVALDRNGHARIDIPLNDSLTEFRIVAVASAGTGLFGTGDTSIRSTQDLMLLSGLPPLVREGDRLLATFTVRNATSVALNDAVITATPTAGGGSANLPSLEPQVISLEPGEAREVNWSFVVPPDSNTITWDVSASHGDGAVDRLSVTQDVLPAIRTRTFQATLAQVEGTLSLPVAIPSGALPGRGGIRITLAASLADQLEGVRDYMREYPYTCLEQRISRAVALRDVGLWDALMNDLPSYLDSDGMAKFFPILNQGDDTLTAYLLAIAAEADWRIPAGVRDRMLEGLRQFVAGRTVRHSALPTADLTIRKLSAIEALSRYDSIEPDLLSTLPIALNLWPTSAVLDWINVLARTGGIQDRERLAAEARQILRARLNFQGTTMGFSTERADYLWWLMISADSNANRAIMSLILDPEWREDLPRMVRGTLGRQRNGHWSTTVANAWGVLALEAFRAHFEHESVTGVTTAGFAGAKTDFAWAIDNTDGVVETAWPANPEPLRIDHDGNGQPWAMIEGRAALPLQEAISSGYWINRTLSAVERRQEGVWSRGDVARIRLEIEAQTDMSWVVVNDPIPAGALILGSGLGGDSRILSEGEQREGQVWPAYEERRLDSFRAYYHFVPKGRWVVEYTVRLNNPGTFAMPETRVEAMYAPEMYGEIPNAGLTIQP